MKIDVMDMIIFLSFGLLGVLVISGTKYDIKHLELLREALELEKKKFKRSKLSNLTYDELMSKLEEEKRKIKNGDTENGEAPTA